MATTRAQRRATQRNLAKRCAPPPVDTRHAPNSYIDSNGFLKKTRETGTIESSTLGCAIEKSHGVGNTITVGTGHRAWFADVTDQGDGFIIGKLPPTKVSP